MSTRTQLLFLVALLSAWGGHSRPAVAQQPDIPPALLEKLSVKHLPNAIKIHAKVISGGMPEGDAAFEELKALGVKTVISVDGAKPDVELAKKYGLRYVHLPHGYDGIADARIEELGKAVRDLPGPIYLHCHHGKHRSPAAAAAACVTSGLIPATDARQVLVIAATSENYQGLFQSVAGARRIDDKVLDALKAEFPAVAKLPPMAEAMIDIEHASDHLKAFAAARWKPLADKPALEPAHEALLLREQFTELLRAEETKKKPERFQTLLSEGETAAIDLETQLRDWIAAGRPEEISAKIPAIMERISRNCTACHKQFRDVPLGEKK